ncbi:MAG: U32 family peptidase [Clostridia bacterium]|nr:U32 family peptidase [Clostridia bacterium]
MAGRRFGAELLAPAGSWESLVSALRFGADAVYLGGPFLQLRAGSAGFDMDKVARAVRYAHALGKKVYVASNAFVFPEETDKLASYAAALRDAGADAMIVSDLGGIRTVKRACPGMEVHVSTQANCTNHESANIYYELGAKRVVLARELSIEQIAAIRARIPADMELEAFVHGAMCMAYSGRCMISAYLTGRSANRGGCAQSCRWKFALTEEKRPGEYFPIEEDPDGDTILSSYDLNALPLLDKIIGAGVSSLKIEGRMKTAYYVAGAVNAYRMYLDGGDMAASLDELEAISHRPYSTGFYEGEIRETPNAPASYLKSREYLGEVLAREGGRVRVRLKNKIVEGRLLEALTPGRIIGFAAGDMLSDEGAPISEARVPDSVFTLPAPEGVGAGDYLRGMPEV